ncbi:MAG: hypothetical protein J0H41_17485 [Rhizobiales bacterium]|nr:hypothetical protein [Hyphomicrobiales bacterium]
MPTPPDHSRDDGWIGLVAAAALKRGALIHRASMLMTGVSLIVLLCATMGAAHGQAGALLAAVALLCGAAEFGLAARVAFDADLFAALARDGDLPGFDRAMTGLSLMPVTKAGRPMEARAKGALRLLKRQAFVLAAQGAALFVSLLLLTVRAPT